ncbi:MAG: hypothetical protein ABSF50_07960 [Burkholderiaceae bacterium]|jgi:hypothetical protein
MNLQSLSAGAITGIAVGVVLIVLFLVFLVLVLRREIGRRQTIEKVRVRTSAAARRSSGAPNAWEGADSARGARDAPRARVMDSDLPPLAMNTTDWGAGNTHDPSSQSSLIASKLSASDPGAGVYRTGFNPFYKSTSHIQVEEVADLVQQAELMTTLENYPVAISMLTRHIRETEKPVPKAWLMLFDLYLKTGRRDQYDNLAKGFRALFNARVPSWDKQVAEETRGLESYTAVMGKLQRLWGLPSCRDFLESLLYDDRGGAREGFTLAAYSEILFLIETIQTSELLAQEEEERRQIELKLQSDRPI